MKTKVGMFFGGRSVEHEISIITANQGINAIRESEKYEIIPIYVTKKGKWFIGEALLELANFKNFDKLIATCSEVYMRPTYGDFNLYHVKTGLLHRNNVACSLDVVFPAFHGTNGEDGCLQGLLETIGIPYVGCNPLASGVGMDKVFMKHILKESNIPVIDCCHFTDHRFKENEEAVITEIESKMNYPVIVKPANLGSSIGISKAANKTELIHAIEEATQFSSRILVEKMVKNLREINCSVLGDCDQCEPSLCEEPFRTDEILSYKDKYMGGSASKGIANTVRKLPADLPQETTDLIRDIAKRTFQALSCNGVSRIDFMIDNDTNKVYVNEINTIPGALSFYLWDATGVPFDQLMVRLIELAFKRDRENKRKTTGYDQNIFNFSGGKTGKMKMQ